MQLTEKQLERFWSKVNKTETCWLWTGPKTQTGYGQFSIGTKKFYAHRISYEMFVGEIPFGFDIDHKCRQRNCLRPDPDHLEAVTHRVNILRGDTFASRNFKKTHCPQGHPYNETNTYYYKWHPASNNGRQCKICKLQNLRNFYSRKKLAS